MLKQTITANDVCDLLNKMLKLDYDCTHAIVSYRQKCNDLIAKHETIQVQQYEEDEFPKVGIIGILNGMFGIREDGMGAICYEIENDRILGFKPTPEKDDNETKNID